MWTFSIKAFMHVQPPPGSIHTFQFNHVRSVYYDQDYNGHSPWSHESISDGNVTHVIILVNFVLLLQGVITLYSIMEIPQWKGWLGANLQLFMTGTVHDTVRLRMTALGH